MYSTHSEWCIYTVYSSTCSTFPTCSTFSFTILGTVSIDNPYPAHSSSHATNYTHTVSHTSVPRIASTINPTPTSHMLFSWRCSSWRRCNPPAVCFTPALGVHNFVWVWWRKWCGDYGGGDYEINHPALDRDKYAWLQYWDPTIDHGEEQNGSGPYTGPTLAGLGATNGGKGTGTWDVTGGPYSGPDLYGLIESMGGTSTGTDWL